jgi:catechol 2,3-dioxygenase-like lactoylglutathione lyase family enzyme
MFWEVRGAGRPRRREPTSRERFAMPAIECLVEIGVYADDLDAAEPFYRDVLGLVQCGKEAGRHVFFQVGDRGILLIFRPEATLLGDRLPAHGARGPGHFALGIAAGDLDAWRLRLREHRVKVEHEQNWPHGGHSLYFRDPAGNSVELITPGVWGLPSGW